MDIDKNVIQPERAIANKILKNKKIYCMRDSDEFYIYNSGYYHTGDEALSEIRENINKIAKGMNVFDSGSINQRKPIPKITPYKISPANKNMIIEIIKNESFLARIKFKTPETCIFCKNGIYQTDLKKFQSYNFFKHDPYMTTHRLEVDYNPQVSSKIWDSFLTQLVGFQKVELIYEMLAYFLMPHVRYHKAFILYGPPSSGRTTFIDALVFFLGGAFWQKHISNIRLQALEEDFMLAELRNKLLNFFDDLDEDNITKSEKFRISVTNKHLRDKIKHVQEHIGWNNRVKHLFACNILPDLKKDPGIQFWRRWILVACFSEFKDKERMTEEDEIDPKIFIKDLMMGEKLIEPLALSGLLNRIIEGWHRLESRNHFPIKWDDIDYISGLWLMNVNPVKLFVDQYCLKDIDYEVDYEEFYKELNIFREEKGAQAITRNMMTRSLKMLNIPNFNGNKKIDKRYHPESCGRNYVGLRLKVILELNIEQRKVDELFERENKV